MPAPNKSAGRKNTVKAFARAFGISPETLWGVYGTESGFGANLGPSSAGALGPFQFLPSTARMMHVNTNSFTSSARGAAKYLSDLGANGDPDSPNTIAALNKYSGGGGLTYVNKVRDNGKTLDHTNPADAVTGALGDITDTVTAPINTAQDTGEAIAGGIQWLTDPSSWLRVGKGALGFVLISLGTGALVFVIAKPIAKSVIGVSGTGKAVKAAAKSVATI